MNNPSDNHKPSAAEAKGAGAQSMVVAQANLGQSSRRRFLGKGAAAAPAILTLAAQPALGVTCYSPSGSLSKNTSGGRNYTGDCVGVSPGNYKTQLPGAPATHWPSGWSPTDKISKMYTPVPALFMKPGNVEMTLNEVLWLTGNADPNMFAFHMIGAYFNVLNGYVPSNVLDTTKLRQIWSDIYTLGYYVIGGVQYNAYWIVNNYLKPYYIAP
jgi:hypothetical protein